jgi:hypothetical protein
LAAKILIKMELNRNEGEVMQVIPQWRGGAERGKVGIQFCSTLLLD